MQMNTPTQASLEMLEKRIEGQLYTMAEKDKSLHDPIADGVVDIPKYLASSPRILWILKEPWDEIIEGEASGGDWSLTHELRKGLTNNKGTYPMMAYITYAIFNGFPNFSDIDYPTDNSHVAHALDRIAYINVSKFPGQKTSNPKYIEGAYCKMSDILRQQIDGLAPDIIIGGNTLHLFFNDLGLTEEMFDGNSSTWFLQRDGRLYIHAYHPGQWAQVDKTVYFDDITSVIRSHFPNPH
jgi:hypothetical protein